MKVLLMTNMPDAHEVQRIREEVQALGHEFELFDIGTFRFQVVNGEFVVPGLTDANADVIIPRGVLTQIKPIATVLSHLRSTGTKVFDNGFLEHKYSISKVTDLVKLSVKSIPAPDTYYQTTWEGFPESAEKLGYPVIVKSVRSGQGKGVYKADNKDELDALVSEFDENGKKPKNFLIQEFIKYTHDLRVLVIGESMFSMQRIPKEGEFRANYSVGGSVKVHKLDEVDIALARQAMEAVGMTYAGVDILIAEDGTRYILEVNHFAGMKGMEEAQGKNIVKVFVEHALSEAT